MSIDATETTGRLFSFTSSVPSPICVSTIALWIKARPVYASAKAVAVSMIALALVYLVAGQRAASVSGVAGAFIADLGTRHIGKVGTFLAGTGAIVAITLLTTELDVEGLLAPFATAGERIGEWGRSLAAARTAVGRAGTGTRRVTVPPGSSTHAT